MRAVKMEIAVCYHGDAVLALARIDGTAPFEIFPGGGGGIEFLAGVEAVEHRATGIEPGGAATGAFAGRGGAGTKPAHGADHAGGRSAAAGSGGVAAASGGSEAAGVA